MVKARLGGPGLLFLLTLGIACVLCAFAIPAYALDDASDASDIQASDVQAEDVAIIDADDSDADSAAEQGTAGVTEEIDLDSVDGAVDEGQGVDEAVDALDNTEDESDEALMLQAAAADASKDYAATHANVYRLYLAGVGDHLYTVDLYEATTLATLGWRWEGVGWVAPLTGVAVYRLYNPGIRLHHFTMDMYEYKVLLQRGWRSEGIGWYSAKEDEVPVQRIFDQQSKAGSHMFTTAAEEKNALTKIGWKPEGAAWYAADGPVIPIQGRWLVTRAWGSLDRYWIASDCKVAKNRFIEVSEGAGYTAYAKGNGAVVRGKYNLGNDFVVVADQDGKLASTPNGKDGFIVTALYDGHLERYYYVASKRAMRAGFFTVDGKQYYGSGVDGRIARGKLRWTNYMILADNDGVLVRGNGWAVTDRFDGDLRRYYFVSPWKGSEYTAAQLGFFTVDGKKYYGILDQGYVAHDGYYKLENTWYNANNDGVLSDVTAEVNAFISRAQGFWSPTGVLILVNTSSCRVAFFSGSRGHWNLVRFEKCVCGAPGTPTIRGTYSLGYHLPVLPDFYNALYCTNITGGYFFHSVLISPSELGNHMSHGCVRLNWPTARYVQSLPTGSTVNLF